MEAPSVLLNVFKKKKTTLHYCLLSNQNPIFFEEVGATAEKDREPPERLEKLCTLRRVVTELCVTKAIKLYKQDLCISLHINYTSVKQNCMCRYVRTKVFMISIIYIISPSLKVTLVIWNPKFN